MANFTALMAKLFNKVARKLVWKDVAQIYMVQLEAGEHTAYLTISTNWFAYLTEKESDGLPIIRLIITDGTEGMTEANMDLLNAVAVNGRLYKKDRLFPPFSDPRYWLIELQPLSQPWTP